MLRRWYVRRRSREVLEPSQLSLLLVYRATNVRLHSLSREEPQRRTTLLWFLRSVAEYYHG